MQNLFKRLLDLLNIHPDEDQRWTLSTLFMPSLKVAMFIWGLCCAIDNIGWLVVYHKNREKFLEIKQD